MAEVGNILETFGTSRGKGFEGFSNPAYTMVPDELLDHLMVQLPLAELRIVLYICRRTFGFKKNEDAISISQMLHGIRKKDGTVLDYGVGIAKSTLMLAIRSLVEKGIIIRRDRVGSDGGSLPTVYSLRFKNSKSNDSNQPEGGVPKVSTPGIPDSSTEGVLEIGTDNKQFSKNSYSTPPSSARKWAENFYEKLGKRVSEVKLKRGVEEVQELFNNGFSEADLEYAVSYVTTVYPDTQSIARLSFLIDEALDVQKRGEEKSRRETELQLQVKNSEKELEIRKAEQDEHRKAFETLPEEIQQAWVAKAPRFMRLESSRMAWAIGQFKQQKVGPESGPGNGPRLDPCLDRSQNFQEIEFKKDLVNFVMPKFTDLPPDPTPPTNYIVVGDWGRGGDLGGVEESVKSEGEMK